MIVSHNLPKSSPLHFSIAFFTTPGPLTPTLIILNDQVKKGGVMASSYVGGLSGAFIPVSEDQGMINAVENGALHLKN